MRKFTVGLALLGLLALGGGAMAEIGTIDDVPAATLLLPYFEVNLGDPNGVNTLFSVSNASAAAALVHVTFWTDESVPTLDFDVYLTGYDVQTFSIRDIFNGILPRTAEDSIDITSPADSPGPTPAAISNQGLLSVDPIGDVNFPGSTGPCGGASTIYSAFPAATLSGLQIDHIRKAHTGGSSPIYGGCSALRYGDNIARGYVTIDNSSQCSLLFPSSPGYFPDFVRNINQLWGDYFYVDSANNFAQGETLVHIEACNNPSVGQGADECPFVPGDYTFYARYVAGTASDQRESLATMFATRFVNGGLFSGGTDLIVWRDTGLPLGALTHSDPDGTGPLTGCDDYFSWVPLNQADVVAFDEVENPQDLCFQGDNVSPPTGGAETCFPVETQRVNLAHSLVPVGASPTPSAPFGWMFLNLNTTVSGAQFNPTKQAWVTTVMSAGGRFSVGYDAIKLDWADDTLKTDPDGVLLMP